VYGASKAFVLSFSQALWAEARAAGVAVTALCPGPTRTGFVDALAADVGHTVVYSRLAEPGPVIEAGLRALDAGRAVAIPGVRTRLIAESGRFLPREWLTRVAEGWLRPAGTPAKPSIELDLETTIPAPVDRVWELLTDVERWPSWYRACRWVRMESAGRTPSFRWKAHPVELRSRGSSSTVLASLRSSRTDWACTPSGRSRSAPRPMGWAPWSSITKRRSGGCRGSAA
jgi:polyketide cyclase/dehydrase/lipid transport protein/short subunit dehydrogenase